MAESALDSPDDDNDAHVYFGRRELLATEGLGFPPGDITRDSTAYRAVTHALAQLVQVGAIVALNAPAPGLPTRWGLVLDGTEEWAGRAAQPLPGRVRESNVEKPNNGAPRRRRATARARRKSSAAPGSNGRASPVDAVPTASSTSVHNRWTTRNGGSSTASVRGPTEEVLSPPN